MNKNLLSLCDSAYGTVAKEIALSMGCFEKVDVLNHRFGVPLKVMKKYRKSAKHTTDKFEVLIYGEV